jgi:two-component sensor histidine kinase
LVKIRSIAVQLQMQERDAEESALHLAIVVDGPAVRLNPKSAELVGLLIHELVTNSVKFGALSQSQTQLRVIWWFSGPKDSRLRLEWGESERLIASELHGEGDMLFLSEGVLCAIELPAGEALFQYD